MCTIVSMQIPCAFEPHGCTVKPTRQDYAAHQSDAASSHAALATAQLADLKRELESMKTEMAAKDSKFQQEMSQIKEEIKNGKDVNCHAPQLSRAISKSLVDRNLTRT